MKPWVLLLPLLFLPLPQALSGQCSTPGNGLVGNYGLVELQMSSAIPASFRNRVLAGIRNGSSQWNSAPCGGTPGVDRPRFRAQQDMGSAVSDYQVSVFLSGGFSPRIFPNTNDLTTACAFYSPNSDEIVVYTEMQDPSGNVWNCNIDDAGVLGDHIAHELGHILGLGESSCAGAIKGPVPFNSATGTVSGASAISNEECNMANGINDTPIEQECPDQTCGGQDAGSGSPILIDLDRNGFHLTGIEDPTLFDIDADGALDWTSWTSRTGRDAFLALDRDQNGLIDHGAELFGNFTPSALTGRMTGHGYIPLAELDLPALGGNDNGRIDSGDSGYHALVLWLDSNRDGLSQAWELTSLEASGVVAIDLDYHESRRRDQHGNEFRFLSRARVLVEGKVKTTWSTDVFFLVH